MTLIFLICRTFFFIPNKCGVLVNITATFNWYYNEKNVALLLVGLVDIIIRALRWLSQSGTRIPRELSVVCRVLSNPEGALSGVWQAG